MNLFKSFLKEKCPKCSNSLVTKPNSGSKTIIIKMCPNMHYKKEFHPALETYIESYKIS